MHARSFGRIGPLLAAAALLLGACSDSTGAIEEASLRFDYSGDLAGSFAAQGPLERGSGKPYAVVFYTTGPTVYVTGFQPRADGQEDLLNITLARPAGPGTYALRSDDTCPDAAGHCAYAVFNRTPGPGQPPMALVFTEGTLNITSVTGTEVSGTFSGVAHEDPPSGFEPHPAPYLTTTITHGRFRAPFTLFTFGAGSRGGADAPRLGLASAPRRP